MDPISGQTAGQANPAPQTASATPQEPQSQETKPLDEARVIELATQIASRTAQSLVDKAEYRISAKAQQQIQALEMNKGVLNLSDQQVQDAKLKIITNDVTVPLGEQASNPPVSKEQPQSDMVSEASFVKAIFTEAGTDVDPNDPEWAEFNKVYQENYNDPSPAAGLRVTRAADKAAAAKKARLETINTTAAARVLQGGSDAGGSADGPEITGHALFQQAHRKK